MNTTQLECFLAVAETLNFSKAAEMVNISQPAVSHQISSLEAELGVRLFLRKRSAYKRGTDFYRRCGNDSQNSDEFYPSPEYQC